MVTLTFYLVIFISGLYAQMLPWPSVMSKVPILASSSPSAASLPVSQKSNLFSSSTPTPVTSADLKHSKIFQTNSSHPLLTVKMKPSAKRTAYTDPCICRRVPVDLVHSKRLRSRRWSEILKRPHINAANQLF